MIIPSSEYWSKNDAQYLREVFGMPAWKKAVEIITRMNAPKISDGKTKEERYDIAVRKEERDNVLNELLELSKSEAVNQSSNAEPLPQIDTSTNSSKTIR